MHVREFASLTGVSVRTLHYYDEIGLLKPSYVDKENGYRFYDERSLERMQEILFYRELDFPLKAISEILASPNYDKKTALSEQKRLLTLKKERLERIIDAIDSAAKGEDVNMKAFENSAFEAARAKYESEAREKWGATEAYKESTARYAGYSEDKWKSVSSEMESIIDEFALCVKDGDVPSSQRAQALVEKWQNYISANHYACTKEILAGLGAMYAADERFAEYIDSFGEGTAEFMSKAIDVYCG